MYTFQINVLIQFLVFRTSCVHHRKDYSRLLKMIVGVLTTCRTQYTWDSSM